MNSSFTFHYAASSDLLIEAHREGDEIILDHVWLKNTDILPVLEYEEDMYKSWLLEKIREAAAEEKAGLHRQSLMA